MLNENLQGKAVSGVFSNTPYTGKVIESIKDGDGYNHIIKLDKPITMFYNNPTQTKRNNRMVLCHVNYRVSNQNKSHTLTVIQ